MASEFSGKMSTIMGQIEERESNYNATIDTMEQGLKALMQASEEKSKDDLTVFEGLTGSTGTQNLNEWEKALVDLIHKNTRSTGNLQESFYQYLAASCLAADFQAVIFVQISKMNLAASR